MPIEAKILIAILASYASAGLAQYFLSRAYRSPASQKYLISDDPHRSKSKRELRWRVQLNAVVSIAQAASFAAMNPVPTTNDAPAAVARDRSCRRVSPFGPVSWVISDPP